MLQVADVVAELTQRKWQSMARIVPNLGIEPHTTFYGTNETFREVVFQTELAVKDANVCKVLRALCTPSVFAWLDLPRIQHIVIEQGEYKLCVRNEGPHVQPDSAALLPIADLVRDVQTRRRETTKALMTDMGWFFATALVLCLEFEFTWWLSAWAARQVLHGTSVSCILCVCAYIVAHVWFMRMSLFVQQPRAYRRP